MDSKVIVPSSTSRVVVVATAAAASELLRLRELMKGPRTNKPGLADRLPGGTATAFSRQVRDKLFTTSTPQRMQQVPRPNQSTEYMSGLCQTSISSPKSAAFDTASASHLYEMLLVHQCCAQPRSQEAGVLALGHRNALCSFSLPCHGHAKRGCHRSKRLDGSNAWPCALP